ncbi:glycoside hydrolase family 2 TIM barrel-domain containing protein [Chitinophaga sp. sic0106]|uniref:glycoside hydrolase family 2 protein n=1 Tax=Chitinophaga sp. sic0106 TaxID=2854785 RepID=UPI001C47CBBA|nr:glycoside hydrolase family 2 TIM barrel-domain containing protein [Chitinophaga sp. sic0106]MBV7530765.1 glycoside hydrolase family 2 [Chitinophaga sp. sic0106]
MSARLLLLFTGMLCLQAAFAQETQYKYLSGTDKDHTVNWDFYCSAGRQQGKWTTIPVPSNWEQQGFGSYNYGHDKVKADEQGLYRYKFTAPENWRERQVNIVFDGVMTDAEVKINGKPAGPVHQGGFYRFRYDISKLLHNGSNLLEVKVAKMSANISVNKAERSGDFWVLGGIYRPVFLEVKPLVHIDRVAITADANGQFTLHAYTNILSKGYTISSKVQTMEGKVLKEAVTLPSNNAGVYTLQQSFDHPATWSAETPNRYQAVVEIKKNDQTIHRIIQPFGFRTIEIRQRDGIYVNGVKVILKGVNRHSAWPESGRTLSKEISIQDVNLMKDMNMNAVRMSHYPPDVHFLEVCDSLGLFVLDELTGWQAAYDTVVGHRLVKELVERDVNHPSVIAWDNGNEGGFNRALDADYAIHDPQQRPVLHPWERYNGVDTKHYPNYNYLVNASLYDQDIYLPTEFMHGLYDGGMGAGLADFWDRMLQHPRGAGGFLWAFADEGLVRTDKSDTIDTDGNHAPDGILGPHREKEGSFYSIRQIWSPVHITLPFIPRNFDGRIPIENRYDYTTLAQCRFRWQLLRFTSPEKNQKADTIASGAISAPELAPHEKGWLSLQLPTGWQQADALLVTAWDNFGREIITRSWALQLPGSKMPQASEVNGKVNVATANDTLAVDNGKATYYFSRTTGLLLQIRTPKGKISLSGGPVLAGVSQQLKEFKSGEDSSGYFVSARYEGNGFLQVNWSFRPGTPAKLDYSYSFKGEMPFAGITFQYPEQLVTGLSWEGEGPYRVWKNRLQGNLFGSWYKAYNNTITGESWVYPEFKGYHANVYQATFHTTEQPITFYTGNAGTFLQVFKPQPPKGAANNNTNPAFPEGDIGFLNSISPIGTKFQDAGQMGPESQGNVMLNYTPVKGTLWVEVP